MQGDGQNCDDVSASGCINDATKRVAWAFEQNLWIAECFRPDMCIGHWALGMSTGHWASLKTTAGQWMCCSIRLNPSECKQGLTDRCRLRQRRQKGDAGHMLAPPGQPCGNCGPNQDHTSYLSCLPLFHRQDLFRKVSKSRQDTLALGDFLQACIGQKGRISISQQNSLQGISTLYICHFPIILHALSAIHYVIAMLYYGSYNSADSIYDTKIV